MSVLAHNTAIRILRSRRPQNYSERLTLAGLIRWHRRQRRELLELLP